MGRPNLTGTEPLVRARDILKWRERKGRRRSGVQKERKKKEEETKIKKKARLQNAQFIARSQFESDCNQTRAGKTRHQKQAKERSGKTHIR